jgi:hypothetical protein
MLPSALPPTLTTMNRVESATIGHPGAVAWSAPQAPMLGSTNDRYMASLSSKPRGVTVPIMPGFATPQSGTSSARGGPKHHPYPRSTGKAKRGRVVSAEPENLFKTIEIDVLHLPYPVHFTTSIT